MKLSMTESDSNQNPTTPFQSWWIFLGALPAFLPLVQYREDFAKYFFMGDEWAQLQQIDDWGYWTWVFAFFGENFMPVFKLVWSAILFLGDGSYFFFVLIQFLLHASVVFLLGYLLRQWKMSWFVVFFSQCTLALNYTHIEILMQSIQMSNLLSYSCLLLLAIFVSNRVISQKGFSAVSCVLIAFLSLMGALTFSRGLLIGTALFATFFLIAVLKKQKAGEWLAPALSALIPCLGVGIITAVAIFGKTGSSSEGIQWVEVGRHFFYQVSLNPLYQQLHDGQIGPAFAWQLLIVNFTMLAAGIFCAKKEQRPLLIFFIFFFIGNGLLLALGRSHMSIDTTASWRYQYGVLLCFVPTAGLILNRVINFIPQKQLRLIPQILSVLWVSVYVYDHWEHHSPSWSDSRGSQIRAAASAENIDSEAHTISRFSGVKDGRALELIEKYNLH